MRKLPGTLIALLLVTGGVRANMLQKLLIDWDPEWPQRVGITGVAYEQRQDYVVGNAEIMLGTLDVPKEAIGEIENKVVQLGVKADFWVLPFLNVHAILGSVEGSTTVTPALPGFEPIDVKYEGVVYGVGATLAYGQDWWWTSVTGVITETDLEGDSAAVRAWLITPKIGIKGERFEAWLGATYQSVDERQMGVFDVTGIGTAVYDIELEQSEAINFHVGARYAVTDSIFVTVEGGFGNRESILGHLEFRFW